MAAEQKETYTTSKGWTFDVYVQGNPESVDKTILTVHDLGCNHTSWHQFIEHPIMSEITKRAVWVHVEIPGQGDHATDLPADMKFPSMQEMADELKGLVDHLKVKHLVGLGEGAGANVLARYAMSGDKRILGVCLIHCTGTTAGFMENMKDKFIKWKLDQSGMNTAAEAYLVDHRFGSVRSAQNKEEFEQIVQDFCHRLYNKLNVKNLKAFLNSFLTRDNINDQLVKLNVPVLVVTGTKASHNHTVQHLYEALLHSRTTPESRRNVEYVPMSDIANVLAEKPEKLAECFQYFLQGIGYVAAAGMHHIGSKGSITGRTLSMEEADMPKSAQKKQTEQESMQS